MRNRLLFFILGLLAIEGILGGSNNLSDKLSFNVNFVDSEIQDVIWCGDNTQNDQNVLVQTFEGTIYRSQNKMINFENILQSLIKLGVNHLNSSEQNIGEIIRMIRSEANPNVIILQGSGQVNWITRDCGNTFRAFSKDRQKIKQIYMHPTEEHWMLASTDNVCSNIKTNPCFQYSILWLTENSGLHWKQLTKYVYKFEWGFFTNTQLSAVPKKRIFWVQEVGNKLNQSRGGYKESRHFFYSDDFLETQTQLVTKGNNFYIDKNYLYVVQLDTQANQLIQLKVADPKNKQIRLRDIQVGEKFHKFNLLDTNEGQVFINVNHLAKTSPMGTLYISDATGIRFSTSLLGHVRSEKGDTDFQRVHGIYGTFVANVYEKQRREQFEQSYSSQPVDELENDNFQNKKSSTSIKTNKKQVSMKELVKQKIQTMISFDKGGIWQRIPAPTVDENGKPIKCEKNCYLNIHSSSNDQFNSFYSSSNSIGLVLANGNVGNYLSHQPADVNTYLSRDAGLTWKQIKKGAYSFEIGDHGSIIVIAKDKDYGTTNMIEYTLDEGLTWNQLKVYDEELRIDNIITEPTNVSTTFMVIGQTIATADREEIGITITVDFSPLLTKQCSGASDPNTDSSDYELWVPHGYNSSKCQLGVSITYSRRKQDSICLNGENFERIVNQQVCECSEEDWECDYGYSRQGNSPCSREGTLTEEEYNGIIPDICEDYYQVSKGYRKIPGNGCTGGVDYSGEWRRCPGNEIFSMNNFLNLIYIIIAITAIYYGYLYKSKLGYYLSIISSIIPLSHNKRDFIDFSLIKSDNDDKHLMDVKKSSLQIMGLLLKDKSQYTNPNNNYSNIHDQDEEEEPHIQNEYNHFNQNQYFADDQFDYEDNHNNNNSYNNNNNNNNNNNDNDFDPRL